MKTNQRDWALLAAAVLTLLFAPRAFAEDETPLWAYVPDTISPEWGAFLLEKGQGRERPVPAPDDVERWKALQRANDGAKESSADKKAAAFGVP